MHCRHIIQQSAFMYLCTCIIQIDDRRSGLVQQVYEKKGGEISRDYGFYRDVTYVR